jgi:hypothetical protein
LIFLPSSNIRRLSLSALSILVLLSTLSIPAPALAQQYLRGTVRQEDYLPSGKTPSLKRDDIKSGKDAFSSDSTGQPVNEIEPPAGAFEVPTMQTPPPPQQRNFPLQANMTGIPDFDGAQEQAVPDQPPLIIPQQGQPAMQPPQGMPPNLKRQDPDSAPELQLAWDLWHKRVAEAVFVRFNAMAQLAFRYSRPLAAYVTYTVTRDGRIVNAQIQQKSPNIAFNTMILLVVNSLSGQRDLLTFPQGSKRMSVEKAGMFTQNYGQQGFKYVTGDRETLRPH